MWLASLVIVSREVLDSWIPDIGLGHHEDVFCQFSTAPVEKELKCVES